MIQFLLLSTFSSFVSCGRLDNEYLPAKQEFTKIVPEQISHSFDTYFHGNTGQYSHPPSAPTLQSDNNPNAGDGSYSYTYETGDGIAVQEKGASENFAQLAQGEFSYTFPEEKQISPQYIANESGFQPQRTHLPTPPPVPPILKSIELNKAYTINDGHRHTYNIQNSYSRTFNNPQFASILNLKSNIPLRQLASFSSQYSAGFSTSIPQSDTSSSVPIFPFDRQQQDRAPEPFSLRQEVSLGQRQVLADSNHQQHSSAPITARKLYGVPLTKQQYASPIKSKIQHGTLAVLQQDSVVPKHKFPLSSRQFDSQIEFKSQHSFPASLQLYSTTVRPLPDVPFSSRQQLDAIGKTHLQHGIYVPSPQFGAASPTSDRQFSPASKQHFGPQQTFASPILHSDSQQQSGRIFASTPPYSAHSIPQQTIQDLALPEIRSSAQFTPQHLNQAPVVDASQHTSSLQDGYSQNKAVSSPIFEYNKSSPPHKHYRQQGLAQIGVLTDSYQETKSQFDGPSTSLQYVGPKAQFGFSPISQVPTSNITRPQYGTVQDSQGGYKY